MNPKDLRSANDPEFSPVNTPDISATTPSVTLLDGSTIQSLGDGGWVHFGKTPDGKDFRHTYDENLPAELQARYDRELKAQDKIALVDAPIAPDKLGRFVDNCELGSSVEILTNNGSRYIFQKLSDTLFRLTQTTNI